MLKKYFYLVLLFYILGGVVSYFQFIAFSETELTFIAIVMMGASCINMFIPSEKREFLLLSVAFGFLGILLGNSAIINNFYLYVFVIVLISMFLIHFYELGIFKKIE